jgi:hypothetical protein
MLILFLKGSGYHCAAAVALKINLSVIAVTGLRGLTLLAKLTSITARML